MSRVEELRRDKSAGIWTRDPNDFYREPTWASARLFATVPFIGRIWDPACGSGRIVISAIEASYVAFGTDAVERAPNAPWWRGTMDFLEDGFEGVPNIVCNPPFALADRFVRLALERVSGKVAMLLPATWHCGDARSRWLETTPLSRVLALTPRPTMEPGLGLAERQKLGGGTKDFSFYIWEHGHVGPWSGGWLHRDGVTCRKRLERDTAHPSVEAVA